jgi:hypothetical protein
MAISITGFADQNQSYRVCDDWHTHKSNHQTSFMFVVASSGSWEMLNHQIGNATKLLTLLQKEAFRPVT